MCNMQDLEHRGFANISAQYLVVSLVSLNCQTQLAQDAALGSSSKGSAQRWVRSVGLSAYWGRCSSGLD